MDTQRLTSFFLVLLLSIPALSIKSTFAAADHYLGEINYFAGNFAPRGWAFCDGQLLAVSQNDALFSLLGTTYGGDGRTTFALPDMRGRVAVHYGNGAGISSKSMGEKSGAETVTATHANLPPHNHSFNVSVDNPSSSLPTNRAIASAQIYSSSDPDRTLHNSSMSHTGGNTSMNKVQPSVTTRCIIALTGIYPSRS